MIDLPKGESWGGMLSVLRRAWTDGGDMSCPGGAPGLVGEAMSTLCEFLGRLWKEESKQLQNDLNTLRGRERGQVKRLGNR